MRDLSNESTGNLYHNQDYQHGSFALKNPLNRNSAVNKSQSFEKTSGGHKSEDSLPEVGGVVQNEFASIPLKRRDVFAT